MSAWIGDTVRSLRRSSKRSSRVRRLFGLSVTIIISASSTAFSQGDCSYGPDTCLQGYVWREAGPPDHVCVRPYVRQQRVTTTPKRGHAEIPTDPYGPDTCVQGYVWREAFPGDHVCVPRQTRSAAARENSQADARMYRTTFCRCTTAAPPPAPPPFPPRVAVTVLDIRPSSMPLSSAAPSLIRAVIQSNAQTTSTLHIFVEEYPSGSGCWGSQHQTNGGADFTVGSGLLTKVFNVAWFCPWIQSRISSCWSSPRQGNVRCAVGIE